MKEAVAICRLAPLESYLWAVLGGYCLETGELDIMHECFGALGHVDKLEQIERIKSVTNKAHQAAELRLLAADSDAAKVVQKNQPTLEQIKMAIAQNEWNQALQVRFGKKFFVDYFSNAKPLSDFLSSNKIHCTRNFFV